MTQPAPSGAPIRVGVLSDTHCRAGDDPAPYRRLLAGPFADAALILHAGDVGDLEWLMQVALPGADVRAVQGNCDAPDPRQPVRRVVEVGGKRLGLIHGWGAPRDIVERVAGAFAGEAVDAVIYGHTHRFSLETIRGVTYFNPGSPSSPRGPEPTAGLLTIAAGEMIWRRVPIT
jgi:putative phosphoesterase